MKQIYLITAILLCCSVCKLKAQYVFPSSGGIAGEDNGLVSYTIGGMFYSEISGTSYSIFPGVQIPYVYNETGTKEIEASDIGCSVFPNPVTDLLTIQLKSDYTEGNNLTADLYSLNGAVFKSMALSSDKTCLDMTAFPSGIYLLKINNSDELIKSLSIIKK